ncbi:ubiquinol-cytochrome c reductase iron-sulfur subunit [Agromyces archimandritae]|uniref:Cytochrome bc1 complex Rieske iron-sulfur subunit n=1 Tax=Agromyces archimandritae TaxID=2781962 RepID=A0A975INF1_9MICO|nr:Rieske (2Fe-2S) protein [Agromyces archimandritae]QTX04552.1 Rieske (2Fe-2S) protein [Agromyces archimandritae]
MDVTRRTALRVVAATGGAAGTAAVLAACAPGEARPSTRPTLEGGIEIIAAAEVPVGGAAKAELSGTPVLVAQPEEGEFVVFSASCPHQGCTVAPADTEFDCPCHGSRFALADGAVLAGPAEQPLREIAAELVDGVIVTA